jgi:hypothetical protein
MQSLTDSMLLSLWDRAQNCGPVERALLLLEAALPELAERERVEVDLGTRDAAVLRLRQAAFGTRLSGYVACPACASRLEFDLDTRDVLRDVAETAGRTFKVGGEFRFRLPNSGDLIAVADCVDANMAGHEILDRCCLTPDRPQEWPPAVIADAGAQMAALTGAADIRLAFGCAACGHSFSERLDAPDYVWKEIEHRAHRILDDVHRLACAYGWTEASVLALSPARRAAYLARCEA